MIAHVKGVVTDLSANTIVIDVSGVGYEILSSTTDINSLAPGQEVLVFTHLHIRENSHELFGFLTMESKRLFLKLIGVNGVGPKSALNILDLGNPANISSAIAAGNTAYLSGASGIGKRAAEKIVVELRDKVGAISDQEFFDVSKLTAGDEAKQALVSLGYTVQQAAEALKDVDPSLEVEKRITLALKQIGKK